MNEFYGVLSVFMFITLPSGRDKKVTLATIPCSYAEKENALGEFKEANYNLGAHVFAEFSFREPVRIR